MSSSAISESSSKCYYEFMFTFLLDKTYLGFKQRPVSKLPFLILEANDLIRITGVKGHTVHFLCDQVPIF